MARLIPRKQIEEQQNISGSLSIQQNVEIGQDAIISGSLFVSKSFFFGNDLNDKSEITGSVFLTGSLVIDGELRTAAPNTILSVTSSNSILAVDTQRYAGILAKDFGANVPTLYVSSTDGDDTNDGRTIQFPLRTIKRAASLAAPGYDGRYGFDTGSISNGYVIKVQAGTYLEDNPVILPKNTTIWGAGLRITKINAKTPTEDLFLVNAGCYIAEVTMGGLRLYPDQINPEKGFAVAFQPGAFITTSPYVQNCSQISNQENSFTELYEDIPPGGGGLYVNGDVIDPDSPLASMVLDAYTQISPNGVGCLVNGRGFIQLVSFFNNFSYYAIRVNNGGQATLNNSNISFGLYGMYASGSRLISGSGGNIQARDSVRGTWSCVVNVLNKGLENGLPTITKLNTAEGIRITAPSLYTQSRVSATTTLSTTAADEIFSDYTLISEIVDKGVTNFPTLLAKSSIKGYGFDSPYNILGAEQITSSISATQHDLNTISSSYAALLSILANGTGSFNFKSNTSASKQIGTDVIEQITNIATNYTASVSSSFGTVLNIITKGVSVKPTYIANTSGSIKGGTTEQIMLGVTSSLATINSISASFSIVYNILANGTGSNILSIPANHKKSFVITNNNSSSFDFEGLGSNPTLTLFRGETYKFNVNAIEIFGGIEYPFWIRTEQLEGITEKYDYNIGMVNNGDSRGTITFTVPYNAPNKLYYVSQNRSLMGGKIEIVNSSTTPFDLIKNTLTYPATIQSGSIAKTGIDVVTAYEILVSNIEFIKDEVIQFVSSSWSGFSYPEETCKRDVGYIVNGVAKDLLFGGNEESIRNGLFYYQYPSEATTTQLGPTLTAMKHAAGVSLNLIRGKVYTEPTTEVDDVWNTIRDNKTFVQNEVITYLSSSWSNFYYNEAKCRRDTGYILDAVATDAKYGGNERSIIAGEYYYQYPSLAIVRGDGDGVGQLGQTSDGIRYASGLVDNLLKKKTFTAPTASILSAYNNLINNKELIQNETIQFINVAFPNLKYIQATCKRDVGYIVDNVATDLLYGGIERGITAGRYYYDYPSLATTTQRTSTIAGVKYAKIIGDTIVQNQILDTPRIVYNDEKNFRLSTLTNATSSFSGSATQQTFIGNTFSIIEGIVARGLSSVKSLLAQNTGLTWNKYNPINVSTGSQITSSNTTPNEVTTIGRNFDVVNTIIGGGLVAEPLFTSSHVGLTKVTTGTQTTASFAVSGSATSSLSSSFALVARIIINGTGSLGELKLNTSQSIKVTNTVFTASSAATTAESASISSSFALVERVLINGTSVIPALTSSLNGNIKVTSGTQIVSSSLYSGSLENVAFISSSISIVTKIIEFGEGASPAITLYSAPVLSTSNIASYNLLKLNIPFIVSESIAYISSSWSSFEYDESKCKRDLTGILSGSAEDLIFNANSASIFNGNFYLEFPSKANDSQLAQTLDAINYASRLAQKVIQNIPFAAPSSNVTNAKVLLRNNTQFIKDETIAYLSSSWIAHDYNETTCKRDVGHILDAAITDMVYGGNERTRVAAYYYYTYPSAATGSQLMQTIDGINYANRLAQKTVLNTTFIQAESNKINASNLIRLNRDLIANEVVEYVSSSWSDAPYDDTKCRRDIKYILDAVRTDLVYGGNERSRFAGEYYYRYPSKAIVAGVPSATSQLDSTITGIEYGNGLVQNIIKNNILSVPSSAITNAAALVRKNRAFLQQNTVDYANEIYPNLDYIESKCYRDTGFIVDAVITDLVYGGNERSVIAGRFYYLYPSQATGVQSEETIDSLNFTKGLAKLVAIGGKSIEDGFDIVANVIESGSNSAPSVVLNTADGIKATTALQITSSISVATADKSIISSSFGNILNIVSNGTGSIPTTILKNTNRGVNFIGGTQITSSNTPNTSEKVKVTTGFDTVIDIVANGTGSIPTIVTNVNSLIRRTATSRYITTASIASTYLTASNNSFDIVLDIVENGTDTLPTLIKNVDGLVKITNTNQYTSSVIISSSIAKHISGSFDTIINILQNGTGSKPTTATYNPANGNFVITIPNHSYKASDFIYLKPESFVFTCEMDGNRTEHKLPSVGQRAYNSRLSIISVTTNTITVNVGISGPDVYFTPTAATYDPATGNFVLTVGPHTLSIGEGIVITTGSIAFTCDMDNNQSTKSYPRFGIDPYAGRSFKITNTTYTTLTVNAGISAANKYFTPSAVNYNALTGDMDVTVGQHGLGVGRSVILVSSSIAFTCDQDGNATTHSYPRSGSDPYAGKSIEITSVGFTQHTITNAPYNAETGDVTITIASHGFSNGDYIKISDNSLVYTCILDENLVSKSYPRAGYDYPSGRWLSISGVTTNTFNINVGPSSYTSAHTFISATANGLQRQNGIFRINVGDAGSASGSIHTFVSASANAIQHLPQSVHTFVSASTGAVKHLPQAAHTFVRADRNAVTPIPIIITPNTGANIKVTDATQYFGVSAATQTEANAISASISIVTNIIANGTGSLPTVTLYTSSISSSNVVAAYTILKSNLDFIVSESIAYLSSSWSTASYDESKCRRDLKGILSGSAEDLIFNANSASVFNGKFYYQFPSQAQGAQLNQTLDGIKYASRLAQKLVLNTLFVTQSAQVQTAYTLLVNNKELIKNEVIPYISSSWSTHQYIETTCKRDVGHIIDAVSTDLLYGGNERTVNAGIFYYQYPSDATGSQIQETVTGIEYARNLAFKIIRGNTFVKVSQNKLQAKELIYNNRAFIQNEVISYISASWSTASYNEVTCKRDVGHILDAVTTDIVYGGNERSINAGKFYYEYPSQATTSQLGPTLSGIKYAKDLTDSVLKNSTFVSASNSNIIAYELIFNNKAFIQNETIAYLSSSWSAFSYNQTTCKRDIGYILDAVATDILYGGNERVAKAGEYYYLYPSLATVGNDGDTGGQLNQTLDGIKYAKGITEKIVANLLLQSPTTSELTGFNLLLDNKKFIQSESIAYLSSSWSGGDGFYYNETTCKRDIGHIIDAVRTDLVYGGNERSSKAGEYYYLYPSAAILTGSVSPTAATQKGPTLDGIKYVAGTAENIIANKVLISPTGFTTSSVNLLRQNKKFIQNETVQYIDAFFPNLVYLRETCRRDVGYILDAVITDNFYGGNQRSVIAGQYYYLYPSLATKSTQVRETVAGVDYAKAVAKAIVQNIKLNSPTLTTNTDGNIKVTNTAQYTSSSISASIIEVNQISSSFGLVTGIINDGVKSFTPTTATYNPADGEFVITIPSHTLTKYNSIYIRPESFVFTCEMDGNRTEHKLPGVGQYPYSNKLQIQSVTTNTITVNVGASGPNVEFTPTSASYNPATGNFVVTVGTHNLSVGEGIVLSTGSFAFTCDMDNNQSTKSYPRFGIDPYSVRSIPLTAVTDTTLTFNVGVSAANKYFTPTSASYNALTGDMVVTVGQHGLGVGRSVTLASASIAFTCDQDNNATTHSYPRSGSDPYAGKSIVITSVGTSSHTITNAPYNSSTGVVTLTVAGHGFSNGDYIKISDNSLTYTCVLDDYSVSKSYPRPGYDYPSGRWLEISNVTTNTFTINVGSSNYIGAHTFISATANGLQRQTGTFTINVGDAGSASGSIHTFVSASANAIQHLPQSVHTFVSASAGAIKHLPQSAHTFIRTTKNSISTIPVLVQNGDSLIKVTNTAQYSSSISASGAELDIITSSFKHVADIIEKGVAFVPDSLARNYDYGFELSTPTLLHISSKEQTIGTGSYNLSTQITNVSSSYGTVVNVVKNGLSVLPTLVASTSSSLKVTNANPIKQSISASSFDTNKIASGFDLILNVIENGTSVLPTIISNTSASIKVTDTPQLISGSASGRLQGKLISSSLSLVIDVLLSNGTSSIGFNPSTYPIANSNAKINSAYNLLISNSKFIVDETIAYMSSSWSGFEYTQSKCERDLTGILSGSAFDLLYGGNSASLFNGKFYFDYPSNATGSQLDQTITAIKYASGLAEKVVLNTVFTHISASINQPTSASWNSLRNNKAFIQSESIAYLSSSWSNFDYNETTCKRDIGYVIDAVATDLLYGGNERSVVAGRYYYDYPSQATNAQLEPTLTGIRYAKGTAMNVVVNKQIFTASLEVQYAYDLIKANKLFIQSESVAYVNVKYPNLDYSESKCYRDLGYIIDGVATDLLYGGNERSRDNGDYYYQFPSQANGFGSQVVQTTDAIKYAARFTTASISSTLIAAPLVIPNTQANIKVTNATQLVTSSLFGTVAESTKVSASISIVTNIIANGTGSLPTLIPYVTPSADTNVIYAYNLLKANIGFIVSESIAYLSSSWSTASYDESKCGRDLRGILSGSAEDLLYNANSASLFNGIFYYQYPSQAQGAQINQTLDGINYASKLAQNIVQNVTYVTASANVSASYALIRKNREFIQNETIAYLSSSWSTASYVETTCKRDVGHIIDAVSTDLLYGGNERSTYAGIFYYLYPSQANGTGSQVQATLTGVNYAGQLSKNVAASLTFVTASQIVSASVNLLRKNREFIQNETLAYLTASWSTFEYDKDKCKRDTGFIIDGVITDLLYGGNERGSFNGEFYYKYPSKAIIEGDGDGVGQLGQTIDGINYASRIAQKIAKNILFVTASVEASASFDLLRKNKSFVAAETIAYVSSSWSGVYYNETTCKRDVGYLIDAAATDVLYGGQERSVIAGQYYYLYPSNAINKGVPSTQNQLDPTLTGIRYAGKLSKKVIINPTYLVPSASLLTTAQLLTDNKQLIQKETITFLSSSWSNLKYNEASCSRDLGFIIDAIRTDLVYGGNERSIEAGSYYYKFPSVAIVESYGDNNGQKKQTIDGINFARGISEKIVANTLLSYLAPATKRRQAAERLKGGKDELKQRAIGYTNGAFPYLVYNEASCSRDTGFIVDACVTDLLYGGNERGIRAASSYYDGQYGSAVVVTRDQLLETLETNRYLRTRAEFIAAGAPLEVFGSLIVATGIDYSYNGSGVTFKALPPNQGGSGVADPAFEITELGGGRIFFTSGNQDGDFRIGTGLSINQATGTLVGRTFSKSLFSLVTPFSLALQI